LELFLDVEITQSKKGKRVVVSIDAAEEVCKDQDNVTSCFVGTSSFLLGRGFDAKFSRTELSPRRPRHALLAGLPFLSSFHFHFPFPFCLPMDSETLELCAGLVDAPYVRAAVQARAQRQALIKNLLSHVQYLLFIIL
jgi:hypothetical protein